MARAKKVGRVAPQPNIARVPWSVRFKVRLGQRSADVAGAIIFALSFGAILALITAVPQGPIFKSLHWFLKDSFAEEPQELLWSANLMGPRGAELADLLLGRLGYAVFLPLFCLLRWGTLVVSSHQLLSAESSTHTLITRTIAWFVTLTALATAAATTAGATIGGSIGATIARELAAQIGSLGTLLVALMIGLLAFSMAVGRSLAELLTEFKGYLSWTAGLLFVRIPSAAYRAILSALSQTGQKLCVALPLFSWIAKGASKIGSSIKQLINRIAGESPTKEQPGLLTPKDIKRGARKSRVSPQPAESEELGEEEADDEPSDATDLEFVVARSADSATGGGDGRALLRRLSPFSKRTGRTPKRSYSLPRTDILALSQNTAEEESDEAIRKKSRIIERKLRDFNIEGRVTHAHPGPVITLFEFEPAAGVKVGRISALQDDLSMSLKASSIRIIAPIPGRGTVGIEVPNRVRQGVALRELLESDEYQKAGSDLTIVVGRGISGEPVMTDIAKMPHLLIAGATGTGKSVFINALLLSLLYRCTPEELGLILIDPKILELSIYEGIPHLRVPVVTVPKQVRAVFQWAVEEMDRRYRLMQRYGVRSIDGYNAMVRKKMESGSVAQQSVANGIEGDLLPQDLLIPTGPSQTVASAGGDSAAEELTLLPKLVIVVDELADLMLSVGKDIEDLIARLAQKARAAGIHLILATQRPSVDVITGLIKANFPARISFRVSSRVDSRTILDSMGAEKLLGMGDMLFMMPGADAVRRVHGAFVSDDEVKLVVEALKENQPPNYDQRIIEACRKALEEDSSRESSISLDGDEYDPFFDEAVRLVTEKGQASTSMIQRAFRIGYNRAARIVELMEREGVVGMQDGVKPRQVLAPRRYDSDESELI